MVKKAILTYPDFEVSEADLNYDEYSYTYDLIKKLKQESPDDSYLFIIGADNVKELPMWHKYKDLLNEVQFVVLNRPGNDINKFQSLPFFNKFIFIEMDPTDTSSSEIRKRVKEGKSVSGMVPECIEKQVTEIYK